MKSRVKKTLHVIGPETGAMFCANVYVSHFSPSLSFSYIYPFLIYFHVPHNSSVFYVSSFFFVHSHFVSICYAIFWALEKIRFIAINSFHVCCFDGYIANRNILSRIREIEWNENEKYKQHTTPKWISDTDSKY